MTHGYQLYERVGGCASSATTTRRDFLTGSSTGPALVHDVHRDGVPRGERSLAVDVDLLGHPDDMCAHGAGLYMQRGRDLGVRFVVAYQLGDLTLPR